MVSARTLITTGTRTASPSGCKSLSVALKGAPEQELTDSLAGPSSPASTIITASPRAPTRAKSTGTSTTLLTSLSLMIASRRTPTAMVTVSATSGPPIGTASSPSRAGPTSTRSPSVSIGTHACVLALFLLEADDIPTSLSSYRSLSLPFSITFQLSTGRSAVDRSSRVLSFIVSLFLCLCLSLSVRLLSQCGLELRSPASRDPFRFPTVPSHFLMSVSWVFVFTPRRCRQLLPLFSLRVRLPYVSNRPLRSVLSIIAVACLCEVGPLL